MYELRELVNETPKLPIAIHRKDVSISFGFSLSDRSVLAQMHREVERGRERSRERQEKRWRGQGCERMFERCITCVLLPSWCVKV